MKADDVKWPVQLTTRNGLELQPALSPLGDALAYVSDRTGALEIYIRALTGVAIDRPLTSDGGQNVQPAWSPNGRFIAYHSSARGGIWLMATHGGVARQIVPQGSRPAWSPDGSSLVFQSDEHTDVTPSGWGAQAGSTLWQVEFTGSGLKQLTFAGRPAGGHAAPVWSPDGRFVAFTVFDSRRDNGVWLVERDTGATRVLARGERLYELAVVPDGSAIYASGGEAFIMRLPLDSVTGTLSGPSAVIPVGGVPGVRGLSMAADGKTLAFAGVALSSHIWAQALTRDGEAAGPPRAMTSDTSRRNSLPILSPDGSKIAYISTRGGATPDLWLMNADGGNAHPLAVNDPLELRFALKRWLPDSRRLAYVSSRNGVLSVRSLDVTTGREDMLFSYGPQEEAATEHRLRGSLAEMHLSPSVTRVAFSLLIPADGRKRVYVSGLDTIQPRLLADGHESVGYPAWSPDERTLAVELKDGSSTHAAVIDVATGVLRRLTNVRGHTWVRSWSPDGRKVAAAVLRDGRWSLRAFDVTDGHETTIIPALPPHVYVRYPEWSRQSDLMVFERGELRGNIWTMSIR
jgi:Tol biopolymer transport system component